MSSLFDEVKIKKVLAGVYLTVQENGKIHCTIDVRGEGPKGEHSDVENISRTLAEKETFKILKEVSTLKELASQIAALPAEEK